MRGVLHDDLLYALLILLIKVGESTVVGMLSIERMRLEPTAGCVLIEVVARPDRSVKIGQVNTRALRLSKTRGGRESQCR